MKTWEFVFAIMIMALAVLTICIMIYAGCMIAINAAREDARRQIRLKAHIMADRMYREKIANTVIQVEQHMVVVEDDLGKHYETRI